jgi:hypothetical protein
VITPYGKYVANRKAKQQETRKAMREGRAARQLFSTDGQSAAPIPVAEQPRTPAVPVYEAPKPEVQCVEQHVRPGSPQITYRDDDLVEVTIVGKAVKQRYLLTTMDLTGISQTGHNVDFTHRIKGVSPEKKSWIKRLFRS